MKVRNISELPKTMLTIKRGDIELELELNSFSAADIEEMRLNLKEPDPPIVDGKPNLEDTEYKKEQAKVNTARMMHMAVAMLGREFFEGMNEDEMFAALKKNFTEAEIFQIARTGLGINSLGIEKAKGKIAPFE